MYVRDNFNFKYDIFTPKKYKGILSPDHLTLTIAFVSVYSYLTNKYVVFYISGCFILWALLISFMFYTLITLLP